MRFIDLLESDSEFDCELVTEDYETNFSFVFEKTKITDAGKQYYNKILNSEFKIVRGNIVLLDTAITYEELLDFTRSLAGYCSVTKYEKYFILT